MYNLRLQSVNHRRMENGVESFTSPAVVSIDCGRIEREKSGRIISYQF